jgi:hypothetical protein
MGWKGKILVVASATLALALESRADAAQQVYDFDLTGTYDNAPVTVTGDISIDTSETPNSGGSSGSTKYEFFKIQSASVTVTGFTTFTPGLNPNYEQETFNNEPWSTVVDVHGPIGNTGGTETLLINLFANFSNIDRIFIEDTVVSAAISKQGGSVFAANVPLTGTFGPPPPSAPEPAAWTEVIVGTALMGGLVRRRRALALAI